MKFLERQNESRMIESRKWLPHTNGGGGGRGVTTSGHVGIWGVMEMFYIFIMVVVM